MSVPETNQEDLPLVFPPEAGISASQRLWSEEVALAAAREGGPFEANDPTYEFSNGRRFVAP